MKQTQITNYLKLGILLFGISLVLVNCQKDDDFIKKTNTEEIIIKPITISSIQRNQVAQNKEVWNKIERIKTELTVFNASYQNRTVYSDGTGLSLETDFATLIQFENGYHSYTFLVNNTPEGEGLQNVLLSLQEDGSYKEFLVHYNITDQEIELLDNGQEVDFVDRLTITEIDGGFSDQLFSRLFYEDDCKRVDFQPNTCSSGNHEYGDTSCNYIGDDNIYTQEALPGGTYTTTLKPCSSTSGGPIASDQGPHGGVGNGNTTTPTTSCRCPGGVPSGPMDGGGNDANCQNLNLQSQDTNFTDKLKDLRDNISPTDETGYVQVPADANATSYNYTAVQGSNGNSIDIIFTPGLISGYYHTHFDINNQLSVFSLSDLWSLYELAIDGDIFDDTFTLVLITAHGTKYAIKFSDVQAFVDFGNEWFVDWGVNVSPNPDPNYINKQKTIEDEFERVYGIKPRPVDKNHKNEKNFAKFLDHYDMGLELFKSNDDFTQWVKVNKNGTTTPCN